MWWHYNFGLFPFGFFILFSNTAERQSARWSLWCCDPWCKPLVACCLRKMKAHPSRRWPRRKREHPAQVLLWCIYFMCLCCYLGWCKHLCCPRRWTTQGSPGSCSEETQDRVPGSFVQAPRRCLSDPSHSAQTWGSLVVGSFGASFSEFTTTQKLFCDFRWLFGL